MNRSSSAARNPSKVCKNSKTCSFLINWRLPSPRNSLFSRSRIEEFRRVLQGIPRFLRTISFKIQLWSSRKSRVLLQNICEREQLQVIWPQTQRKKILRKISKLSRVLTRNTSEIPRFLWKKSAKTTKSQQLPLKKPRKKLEFRSSRPTSLRRKAARIPQIPQKTSSLPRNSRFCCSTARKTATFQWNSSVSSRDVTRMQWLRAKKPSFWRRSSRNSGASTRKCTKLPIKTLRDSIFFPQTRTSITWERRRNSRKRWLSIYCRKFLINRTWFLCTISIFQWRRILRETSSCF